MICKNVFSVALLSILGMAAALPEYRSFNIAFGQLDKSIKTKKNEAHIVDEIFEIVGYSAGFNGVLDDNKWLEKAERKAKADRRGLGQEELGLLPHEYEMLEILEQETAEDQANRKLGECWEQCPPSDCRIMYAAGNAWGACCACCYTQCEGRRSLYEKERELDEDLESYMMKKASDLCHGASRSLSNIDCDDVSVELVRGDE